MGRCEARLKPSGGSGIPTVQSGRAVWELFTSVDCVDQGTLGQACENELGQHTGARAAVWVGPVIQFDFPGARRDDLGDGRPGCLERISEHVCQPTAALLT